MNEKINIQLNEVCNKVKCKTLHSGIRAEFQDHNGFQFALTAGLVPAGIILSVWRRNNLTA